jgi:hypothetical protein
MATKKVEVVTGSDAFILTSSNSQQNVDVKAPGGREFRLTITIAWEEYRQPSQTAGTLWLEYQLGKTTPALPGIEAAVPIENQGPKNNYFLIVTRGLVSVNYAGLARAHVWLSYYAEYLK